MKIPKQAEAEICRKLAENLQISSDEISDILEKYGVREDDRALQRSYRKRLGQQLMASFRDETGKREILAAPNGKGGMVYIIIDCCNDAQKLQHIQWKLQSQAAALRFWPAMCRPVRACVGFSRWRTTSGTPRGFSACVSKCRRDRTSLLKKIVYNRLLLRYTVDRE